MSLNEMNLPPYLVAQLYPSSLVGQEKKPDPITFVPTEPSVLAEPELTIEWKSLGSNRKGILVAVNYENITNLPDAQLEFLMQLLKACQLSLHDVALINMNNYPGVAHTSILSQFSTKVVLLFGITIQDWGFPFQTPPYQVQSFSDYTVMHAPALHDLQNDKPAKGLLWAALKNIFHL
jgi:DNA polymerase III psi subunit